MTLAIARVSSADGQAELGTAFVVPYDANAGGPALRSLLAPGVLAGVESLRRSGTQALTAFHCIGDRHVGTITEQQVTLAFPEGTVLAARVTEGDPAADVALLELASSTPDALEPVPISASPRLGAVFFARGYPEDVRMPGPFSVSGTIKALDAWIEGAPALELYVSEASQLSLHGLSGAPVLSGEPPCAVGVIRWCEPRPDRPELAIGATAFAAPLAPLIARWPALASALYRSPDDDEAVTAIEDITGTGISLIWGLAQRARGHRESELLFAPPARFGRMVMGAVDVAIEADNQRRQLADVQARWRHLADRDDLRMVSSCCAEIDRAFAQIALPVPTLRFGEPDAQASAANDIRSTLTRLGRQAERLAELCDQSLTSSIRPDPGGFADAAGRQRLIQSQVRNHEMIDQIDAYNDDRLATPYGGRSLATPEALGRFWSTILGSS